MSIVKIPYGRQSVSAGDIEAVVEVLKSDWLTQGPAVENFERATASYCRSPYAVAVNSATSALHIACLAAGLGPGDRAWTSPNTFVASANCALYCGAAVDFVDIDPATYAMSAQKLQDKLITAAKENRLPRVVIPVHFAGQPCDMDAISALSRQYGFTVIEDASHAIGSSYRGMKTGSCEHSGMTVFSFHPVKIITTGEGGMITTGDKTLYDRMIRLRSHGITRDAALMDRETDGPWYYQQIELGFNYRMTDIQAALGTSQLKRVDQFVERRRMLAERYRCALQNMPVVLPEQHADRESAWHLYVVRLKLNNLRKSRRQIFEELRKCGIGVNVHYIPVHTQPYYRNMGFSEGMFPEAECYYAEAISLPLYFGLKEEEQDYVISCLRTILA